MRNIKCSVETSPIPKQHHFPDRQHRLNPTAPSPIPWLPLSPGKEPAKKKLNRVGKRFDHISAEFQQNLRMFSNCLFFSIGKSSQVGSFVFLLSTIMESQQQQAQPVPQKQQRLGESSPCCSLLPATLQKQSIHTKSSVLLLQFTFK